MAVQPLSYALIIAVRLTCPLRLAGLSNAHLGRAHGSAGQVWSVLIVTSRVEPVVDAWRDATGGRTRAGTDHWTACDSPDGLRSECRPDRSSSEVRQPRAGVLAVPDLSRCRARARTRSDPPRISWCEPPSRNRSARSAAGRDELSDRQRSVR